MLHTCWFWSISNSPTSQHKPISYGVKYPCIKIVVHLLTNKLSFIIISLHSSWFLAFDRPAVGPLEWLYFFFVIFNRYCIWPTSGSRTSLTLWLLPALFINSLISSYTKKNTHSIIVSRLLFCAFFRSGFFFSCFLIPSYMVCRFRNN